MEPSEYTRCQVVEKPFVNKIGEPSEVKELYLRCSVADYYIKFCESTVSRKDLEPYLNKGIQVKMEIREGSWDICPEDSEFAQSRIGQYVVIKEIRKKEKKRKK